MSQLEIRINGESRSVSPSTSLSQLLEELSLQSKQVAIEVNMELIPRTKHSEYEIQPGDEIEIVTLAGGG